MFFQERLLILIQVLHVLRRKALNKRFLGNTESRRKRKHLLVRKAQNFPKIYMKPLKRQRNGAFYKRYMLTMATKIKQL